MYKKVEDIDFGTLSHYRLLDNEVFSPLNTTSLIIKELIHITKILDSANIKYNVDKDYKITIKAQD